MDPHAQQEEPSLLSLSRVNFSCKPGELVAVVGSVGSGKSTLLKALLGDVRRLGGDLCVRGKIAYVPQTPFIMNATVRSNIVFGNANSNTNEQLYQRAINACALQHDLDLLPRGNECLIGEKGITLSGGQKARIGLARAVYHRADITLLDDPLAAVDAHVGRHLFEECILGALLPNNESQRSVILVTNALQYLTHPRVNKIVVLDHGRIIETGTYNELSNNEHSRFSRFLKSFNETKTLSANDEEEEEESGGDESNAPKLQEKKNNKDDEGKNEATKTTDTSTTTPVDTEEENATTEKTSLLKGKNNDGLQQQQDEEERETGKVDIALYKAWADAAGGLKVVVLVLLGYSLAASSRILSNWWLTYWSEHGKGQLSFLVVYGLINVSSIFLDFSRSIIVMLGALQASKQLFARVLASVMRAPMAFFDTTPLGRIVNRFSKDIYTVDEALPSSFDMVLMCLFDVLSVIVVVCTVTPVFAISLLPMIWFYRLQQRYFTTSYRELKRLDSVRRSPIYALFGETLDGVSTIRAFSAQGYLLDRMSNMIDSQQHAFFLTSTGQCWLAVRLEMVGTAIIFAACVAVLMEHGNRSESFAGLAGLSISYALQVTQSLNWMVRVSSDLEANMVAVERLEQYVNLPQEAARETDTPLPSDWPSRGELEFQNVKMRYRSNLPLVLRGLNILIPSFSKVGVVGRTGAGKSSLLTALLRIVELDKGKVILDGVDTATIGLEKLRSEVAVIPQDPVLFSGSVRKNLDPFDNNTDEELTDALTKVGLMSSVSLSSDIGSSNHGAIRSLQDDILEGGGNLSVGQRQLLVIARALLTGSRVVVCDEATSGVDTETDAKIQHILREEFQNATCLTIAHRLNTIMDSDFILVMDDGRVAEFDSPEQLLAKESGLFKGLVETWEEEHRD